MLLETVFTALLPAGIDGVRALINRFTGGAGAKPSNIAESIQLMDADIRKLEALAQLDSTGDAPQWVHAIRGLQRPIIGLLVLLTWMSIQYNDSQPELYESVTLMAQSVIFYLFGDRTYLYLRKKGH